MKHPRKPLERARMRAYGAVQGVGFRYFVSQHARALGLRGYVLNRPDGSVELEASGTHEAMLEFIHTVGNGPPMANVERVETLEPGDDDLPDPFEIRRSM